MRKAYFGLGGLAAAVALGIVFIGPKEPAPEVTENTWIGELVDWDCKLEHVDEPCPVNAETRRFGVSVDGGILLDLDEEGDAFGAPQLAGIRPRRETWRRSSSGFGTAAILTVESIELAPPAAPPDKRLSSGRRVSGGRPIDAAREAPQDSLHFSPRGERKCVRGLSDRGARRSARAGVLGLYVEHGGQAQRRYGGPIARLRRQGGEKCRLSPECRITAKTLAHRRDRGRFVAVLAIESPALGNAMRQAIEAIVGPHRPPARGPRAASFRSMKSKRSTCSSRKQQAERLLQTRGSTASPGPPRRSSAESMAGAAGWNTTRESRASRTPPTTRRICASAPPRSR